MREIWKDDEEHHVSMRLSFLYDKLWLELLTYDAYSVNARHYDMFPFSLV